MMKNNLPNKKIMKKSSKGITLIALVITVIVLLILAGISISMLAGNNSILNQSTSARTKTIHANVLEKMQLEASAYTIYKTTEKYSNNLIDYLKSKSIILDISGEENKWLINVTTLLGYNQSMGTGTYPNDVYVLEKQETSTGSIVNTKVATTEPIKIAVTNNDNIIYKIVYYASVDEGKNIFIGNITDNEKQIINLKTLEPDIGKEEFIMECKPVSNYGTYDVRFETQSGLGQAFTVDWGDGTIQDYSDDKTFASHSYIDSSKTYDIKISGTLNYIRFETREPYYSNCLRKIKQWGTVNLNFVWLNGCTNLTEIAEPTQNSFNSLETIGFLNCTSLNNIPENLFFNCPKLTSFNQLFQNCTSLTSIPEYLFYSCNNVTSFYCTFDGCTGLTGKAIKLWERVENGENNGYEGEPDGKNCYRGCTGLSNYDSIPNYWKDAYDVVIE